MKVFISWSGEKSQKLAEILREWLPAVVQAVQPYFTPNDIDKGSRWAGEIAKELEGSSVGIICLTRSNLQAPWLMFEAGALAKSMDKARVVPILFDLEPSDLQGPLVQFQAASFIKSDFLKLLKTINSVMGDRGLKGPVLESVFEKWWPELETKVKGVLETAPHGQETGIRNDREILEEILQLTRANIYRQNQPQLKAPKDSTLYFEVIEILKLPSEINSFLSKANITFLGDLVTKTPVDIIKLDGIGKNSLRMIESALLMEGLSLGLDIKDIDYF